MIARVIRRILTGILFLLFVGGATIIVLRPSLVDVLVARFNHFRAEDVSTFSIIHPSVRAIRETIEVKNARIVPDEDTELAFPFSGTLDQVMVKEGDIVEEGAVIAFLETKALLLQKQQAEQRLSGAEAALLKLKNGTRKEDIAVSLEREKLSATTISSARSALADVLLDTYTKIDDMFENKLKAVISTNRGEDAKFLIPLYNAQIEEDIKAKRANIVLLLSFWKKSNEQSTSYENIAAQAQTIQSRLVAFSEFFDEVGEVVNTVDGNDASVVAARKVMADIRVQMTALRSSLTDATSQLKNAEDASRVTTSERVLKEAPTKSEDIRIAETEIEDARNQIAIIRDNINHATLKVPHSGMVVKKVFHKRKEIVSAGEHIVLLAMPVLKLHADVPEEDIAKVSIGATASISLKSYRGRTLFGKAVSIEPNEVIKNESTYFRVNIFFDEVPEDVFLRSGMTSDVAITTGSMESVVFLPKRVLTYKDGRYTVAVKENNMRVIVPVAVGESDGEDIHVIGNISTQTEVLVE